MNSSPTIMPERVRKALQEPDHLDSAGDEQKLFLPDAPEHELQSPAMVLEAIRTALRSTGFIDTALYTKQLLESPNEMEIHGALVKTSQGAQIDELIRQKKSTARWKAIARNVPPDFVQRASSLYEAGFKGAGLDLVFDAIDDLLSTSHFALVDSALMRVQCSQIPPTVLLALLATTATAASKLATWKPFAARAVRALEATPGFDQRAIAHVRNML